MTLFLELPDLISGDVEKQLISRRLWNYWQKMCGEFKASIFYLFKNLVELAKLMNYR